MSNEPQESSDAVADAIEAVQVRAAANQYRLKLRAHYKAMAQQITSRAARVR